MIMAYNINQLEKNVSASFGYVKKDLLMLNDAISDLHDKIQHISMNHALLLEKIQSIENAVVKDEKTLKKVSQKAVKQTSKKKATTKKTTKKAAKPVKKVVTETVTYV